MPEIIMSYELDETGKMINLQQAGELVRCEDCQKKPFCFSEVVMVDKYKVSGYRENVTYCSSGKRKEDE